MNTEVGVLIFVGVVLLAVIAGSLMLNRRREDTWKAFARRMGLSYELRNGRPALQGEFEGRKFTLSISGNSSDTGVLGVEETVMALEVPGDVPMDLEAHSTGPGGAAPEEVLEGDRLTTGDEEFDQKVFATAKQIADSRRYLDSVRRAAILRLVDYDPSCIAGIKRGQVYLQEREMVTDPEHLQEHLELLREVSQGMAAPARGPSESGQRGVA